MKLKRNNLKTAFIENRQTYGSWITVPNVLIPEIMSRAGFDSLCIDMEHSSIELMDLLPLNYHGLYILKEMKNGEKNKMMN